MLANLTELLEEGPEAQKGARAGGLLPAPAASRAKSWCSQLVGTEEKEGTEMCSRAGRGMCSLVVVLTALRGAGVDVGLLLGICGLELQVTPWPDMHRHQLAQSGSQLKPNVLYMSWFYLELTPSAGLDLKLKTFSVFSQQGISSGCRIHQRGLHVANTHFVA